ncbi:MAG: hypothetical protein WCJ54_01690, partial [Actinomycetota bacterium]
GAAESSEPRQVREEAAVSKLLWVPQGSLAGASCGMGAWCYKSKPGAWSLLILLSKTRSIKKWDMFQFTGSGDLKTSAR